MTKLSIGVLSLFLSICLISACETANQPVHSSAPSTETAPHSKLVHITEFDGQFQIDDHSMVLTWFPLHPAFGLYYPEQWYNLNNQVTISIMPDNAIVDSGEFITDDELSQFSDYMGSTREAEHQADFFKLQNKQSSAIVQITFQDMDSDQTNRPFLMDILGSIRFIPEEDQIVNKTNNDRAKSQIDIRVYEGEDSKSITVAGAQEDAAWAFTGLSDFGFYVPSQLKIHKLHEGYEFRTIDQSAFMDVLDTELLPIPKLLYKLDELSAYAEYIGSTRTANRQDDYFTITYDQSKAHIRLSFTNFETINTNRAILLDVMNSIHYTPKPYRGVTNVPY